MGLLLVHLTLGNCHSPSMLLSLLQKVRRDGLKDYQSKMVRLVC